MSLPELQNGMQQAVGIQVSSEWLQECVDYLNQQHQSSNSGSLLDRCLHQLLYTDIRDLVDPAATSPITNLQGLIARSKTSPPPIINGQRSTPIQTPADFRLLVQLEEAVDLSLSREHRFNPQHFHPPEQNNRNNNNNDTPRQRCLKLCLTSGHSIILLAQEVTRIFNLQPDSPAGTKISLHSNIVIRHGYLQLHNGNTTVLGGQVAALVQLQQAAMEQARKAMGVGVDPTVRALVGVEGDLEEPTDEGNEQSGDVEMATAANSAQSTTTSSTAAQSTATSFTAPAPFTAASTISTASISVPTTTNERQSATGTFSNHAAATTTSTTTKGNPYQSHPPSAPPAPAPIIQAPNNPYRNIGPFGAPNNPQQQGNPPPSQSSSGTTTQNPYARRQQGQTPRVSISPRPMTAPNNPYASSSNTNRQVPATSPFSTATENAATPASNSSTAITHASTSSANARSNPYLKSNANQGQSAAPAIPSNSGFRTASSLVSGNPKPPSGSCPVPVAFTPPGAYTTTTMDNAPPSSNVQNMTFANLHKLLGQCIQNRQLYETYQNVTFRVAMVQKTDNILFNVGKNKDYKKASHQKENASKYIFVMNTTFGSADANSPLVACKLPSSLTTPYFGISATELRALSKSDRVACDRLAKQGGDKVADQFFKHLQYWKARLDPTPDQVFASNNKFALDNVETPILILEPDKT